MVLVEAVAKTDVGKKRKLNEDSFLVDKSINLYAVADGMGGHKAGEVASRIVVDTIKERMTAYIHGSMTPNYYDETLVSKESALLLSCFEEADSAVYSESQNSSDCKGMGSTLSAVFFTENSFVSANVGDSPVLWIHKGEICRVYVPHTYLSEKAKQQSIGNPNAIYDNSLKSHILTRSVGVKADVEPSFFEVPCYKNDYIVIASDGLTDKIQVSEIRDIVMSKRSEKACDILIDMANERGGEDNITVLIIKVKKVKKKWGFWGLF